MVQIDMEMPRSCYDCPCCYDLIYCNLSQCGVDQETAHEKRPDWCPLKEVKDDN